MPHPMDRQAEAGQAERFVLLCLRSRWDPSALKAARDLASSSQLQWEQVDELARTHALAPLLYHVLRDEGILPAELRDSLARVYLANAARNSALLHEALSIVTSLGERGVETILLKGAALAEAVYESIALRPMGDLDLLVRRDAALQAVQVLCEEGFALIGAEARPDALLAVENEVVLHRATAVGVPVELHWSLFDSPFYQDRLPMEWFWETAVPMPLDRGQALMLGPEAQLLHLCGHLLLHHQGEGLLWLHDIAEVIARYGRELDWETLLARGQECHLVLALQRGLERVHCDWRAPIPDQVLARLRALSPSLDERRVVGWLGGDHGPVVVRLWHDLASMDSWPRRVRYAATSVFPSPSYMRSRYDIRHPFFLPLYYPYRWLVGLRELLR